MADSFATADGYDDLCKFVGRLSLQWSQIEHTLRDICSHYAAAVDIAFDGDGNPHEVLNVGLATMDLRQTISVAKTLIFMSCGKRVPSFYAKAETLLNYIDNDLRAERNRFIHDLWGMPSDASEVGFSRYQMGPRVFSVQSRTRAYATITERYFLTLKDVEKFNDVLELAQLDLNELDAYSAALVDAEEWPDEPPPDPPQEWQSLGRRDWRGHGKPNPRS